MTEPDHTIDSESLMYFHPCEKDCAVMVHAPDGTLIEYYRPPPKKVGASVKDMHKFQSLIDAQDALDDQAVEESLRDPSYRFWLGVTLVLLVLCSTGIMALCVYAFCR